MKKQRHDSSEAQDTRATTQSEAPAWGREGGAPRHLAVRFYLAPVPGRRAPLPHDEVVEWASSRLGAFFGRAPVVAERSTTLLVFAYFDVTGAAADLTDFASRLQADAANLGYRCACESTYRWGEERPPLPPEQAGEDEIRQANPHRMSDEDFSSYLDRIQRAITPPDLVAISEELTRLPVCIETPVLIRTIGELIIRRSAVAPTVARQD
ncbi:MAG: hypothetical protein H7066_17435 [Cytophagaceae bacterium]|nr:hypothetical protein [Gemmatimonadaceae bacterium]